MGKMKTDMQLRQSFGWLIIGHVNILLSKEEGCCNKCCGPCSALVWLRDTVPNLLERWVGMTDSHWSWFSSDGIDWARIEAQWDEGLVQCHCKGLGALGLELMIEKREESEATLSVLREMDAAARLSCLKSLREL